VAAADRDEALSILRDASETAFVIGRIEAGDQLPRVEIH
jgi:phosphoribosylaminoimidazole (AIR) synthetase